MVVTDLTDAARKRLESLGYMGELGEADARAKGLEFVETTHGQDQAKDHIHLTALVDDVGVIKDLRYRSLAIGTDLLVLDVMAEMCVGRRLDQLPALSVGQVLDRIAEDLDQQNVPFALPREQSFPVLVKLAGRRVGGQVAEDETEALPWSEIGLFEKVRRIEELLNDQVRPMLASDGGGMDLVDLRGDELVVQYSGACGSCGSAIGGTMQFIEDTLSSNLGVDLKIVVQDLERPPFEW